MVGSTSTVNLADGLDGLAVDLQPQYRLLSLLAYILDVFFNHLQVHLSQDVAS